jgi:hypothetical protein
MAFLAILDLPASGKWPEAKDLRTPRSLRTREIIRFWQEHFGEDVSYGSYDDVRRKDLLHLQTSWSLSLNRQTEGRQEMQSFRDEPL